MDFSSFAFLLYFLPAALIVYHVLPKKWKNSGLFALSMLFYVCGCFLRPRGAFGLAFQDDLLPGFTMTGLLLLSMTFNFLLGRGMTREPKRKKTLLTVGIVADVGVLAFCKYANFLIAQFNLVFGTAVPALRLILPVGISFYTFQMVAYLVDVYRNAGLVLESAADFGAYVAMFPKLISGPITRFADTRRELWERTVTRNDVWEGIGTFVIGLGYKVLLADRLSGVQSAVARYGYECISTPLAWLGIIAYSLQIYFDFYGYSLMAMGLGRFFGFHLPENFRHPYTCCTMTQFWRNWHITLGAWFREYVYIPLGGNRAGRGRTYLNLLIVWLLTGLWHGTGWNFLLWGLFLFVIIALEKTFYGKWMESHRAVGHVYMCLLIPLSWLPFHLGSLEDLVCYLSRLIGLPAEFVNPADVVPALSSFGIFIVIGIICVTNLPQMCYNKLRDKRWAVIPLWLLILAGVAYCLYNGMNDPFLYFQF